MSKFIGIHLFSKLAQEAGIPNDTHLTRITLEARVMEVCTLTFHRLERKGADIVELEDYVEVAWEPLFKALAEAGVIQRPDFTRAVTITAAPDEVCTVTLEMFGDDDQVVPAIRDAARIASERKEAIVR